VGIAGGVLAEALDGDGAAGGVVGRDRVGEVPGEGGRGVLGLVAGRIDILVRDVDIDVVVDVVDHDLGAVERRGERDVQGGPVGAGNPVRTMKYFVVPVLMSVRWPFLMGPVGGPAGSGGPTRSVSTRYSNRATVARHR
jgi:hypothetical protein